MKISELVIYPLLSLALVLFIYYLATKDSSPPVIHKPIIRIQPLKVSDTAHPESNEKKDIPMATNQKHTFLLHTSMYSQQPFINEQYSFIPSERIYLVIELQNLQAGRHTLSASWKIHSGKTVSISSHEIVLPQFTTWHRSYFWLELMKNGRFTEMLTGREYKGDAYGAWEVEVAFDGTVIAVQQFEIKDF
jgi:hypothetical protein